MSPSGDKEKEEEYGSDCAGTGDSGRWTRGLPESVIYSRPDGVKTTAREYIYCRFTTRVRSKNMERIEYIVRGSKYCRENAMIHMHQKSCHKALTLLSDDAPTSSSVGYHTLISPRPTLSVNTNKTVSLLFTSRLTLYVFDKNEVAV